MPSSIPSTVPRIQLLQQVGIDDVVLQARKFGIRSPLQHDLSLALGASEVTLEELTGAYAALANKGRFIEPYQMSKILDRNGRVLEARKIHAVEAYDARHAYQLTSLLQEVIRGGDRPEGERACGCRGGKDRHHRSEQGRLVYRLHPGVGSRGLVRFRSGKDPGPWRDRRQGRGPGLGPVYERGGRGAAQEEI